MNYCIPMPDGSLHSLTPHEANILRGFLGKRLAHSGEPDQPAVLNLIRHLDIALAPETQHDDLYTPPGYAPAWQTAA